MQTSEIIAHARQMLQWSEEELADRVEVSARKVRAWESGKTIPTIAQLIRLSDALGVSLDTLVKEDPTTRAQVMHDSPPHRGKRLVVIYLLAVVVYILFMKFKHRIFMVGFLVATVFVLAYQFIQIVNERRSGR